MMRSAGTVHCFLLVSLILLSARGHYSSKPTSRREDQLSMDALTDTSPLNLTCMTTNCGSAYQTCLLQPKCQQLLQCLDKCYAGFDTDVSLMKSDTLSCMTTCTFTYADFYYTGFSRCLTDNKCLTLPYVMAKCRYPEETIIHKKYQISDLKGGWWVARGYYPALDCIACQHIFFDGFEYDKDRFVYRPTFEALTVNGSFTYVNGSILVNLENTDPGEAIELDYYIYGVPVHMTWHVLAGTEDNSTVLVYYCGDILAEWNFEGAMILTRSPVLPPGVDVQFAEMVKRSLNIQYEKFCKPQLQPCPN